jgi:hypothetical protein
MKHVHMVRNRVSRWVSLSDIGRQTQCEDKRSSLTDDLKEYTVNKMGKNTK